MISPRCTKREGIGRNEQAAAGLGGKLDSGRFDIRGGVDGSRVHFDGNRQWSGGERAQERDVVGRRLRIEHDGKAIDAGRQLLEQLQRLSDHRVFEEAEAGDVAARPRQVRNEALPHRIVDDHENDRDGTGRIPQRREHRGPIADQDIRRQRRELRRMGPNAIEIAGRPAIVDAEVATVRPTQIRERLAEGRDARLSLRIALGHPHQHADAPHAVARLRAGDKRPKARRRGSAAEQRYEVAPSHSVIFTSAGQGLRAPQ
jgi:hypothetical protein